MVVLNSHFVFEGERTHPSPHLILGTRIHVNVAAQLKVSSLSTANFFTQSAHISSPAV
jgi:hypothetical protein